MKTQVKIVKQGADHVELEVENEMAADLVADEAQKVDIPPVIGQRREREITGEHYVVLHGVARDVMKFLNQNSNFKITSETDVGHRPHRKE
jgi:hypothetical protein